MFDHSGSYTNTNADYRVLEDRVRITNKLLIYLFCLWYLRCTNFGRCGFVDQVSLFLFLVCLPSISAWNNGVGFL